MADVLLFHHAHGLTIGVRDFAERLRQAGHTVYLPDLYQESVFDELEDGVAYAMETGFDTIIERGVAAAENLPRKIVYAGFSLGVLPAQKLAQTRPGAAGALLFHSCIPVSEFSETWPQGVPVQIHAMDGDGFFVGDGDLDAARALVDVVREANLFLYQGDKHLFADSSLSSYDDDAAALLMRRVLQFLDDVACKHSHGTGTGTGTG